MWECCQCGNVASSNVANFQLGIGNAKLPNGFTPNYRTVIARHRLF